MVTSLDLQPSIVFDWAPTIVSVEDARELTPKFRVVTEAASTGVYVRPRAEDLPSAGIWADRTETDEELLEKLGGNWCDFGVWD